MRALAVFPNDKEIRIVEHPEPGAPGPRQLRAKVLEVGVCGTDKEIAHHLHGVPPAGFEYMVMHHEALAEVVEVGREVTDFGPGDLVVPTVRRPCGRPECTACTAGRQDFCFTGEYTERGIVKAHGFAAEQIVDEAAQFVKVPAALRDIGVLVEPLTIAEKGLLQVWDIQERLPWVSRRARRTGDAPKLRALVLGAGPIGLLGAVLLADNGFDTHVYSLERTDDPRAELVRSVGGTYHSAQDEDVGALWKKLGDVDMVYEATGASKLSFAVLELMGYNGIFVFTGVPGRKEPFEVDGATIMRNLVLENHVLLGTVNAGMDAFEAAVRDLTVWRTKWPHIFDTLISGRYDLEDHAKLYDGTVPGVKHVMRVSA